MTNHDEYGTSAPTRVVPRPRTEPEQYGAWQQPQYGTPQPPQDGNPVVMRTMTEYRAAAWQTTQGAPYGFEAAPRIERRRPSWFWPVVLTATGLVALLGGGTGTFPDGGTGGGTNS